MANGLPDAGGTERKTARLEAFSDAVLAIAITLPVVDLHMKATLVAEAASVGAAYAELAPDYIAYAMSVVVIGLYWAHSHFSGKIVEKTDHGFNLLTVLFLALVSVTPFPSGPFAAHLAGDGESRMAAVVYAGVLAAPSLAWFVRFLYARWRGLHDPRLAPVYLRRLTVKYASTAALFAAGVAVTAFIDWRVGFLLVALTTLGYLIPPQRPQFLPGQEPENELQEAGERPR